MMTCPFFLNLYTSDIANPQPYDDGVQERIKGRRNETEDEKALHLRRQREIVPTSIYIYISI